jgi:hypothetical protein
MNNDNRNYTEQPAPSSGKRALKVAGAVAGIGALGAGAYYAARHPNFPKVVGAVKGAALGGTVGARAGAAAGYAYPKAPGQAVRGAMVVAKGAQAMKNMPAELRKKAVAAVGNVKKAAQPIIDAATGATIDHGDGHYHFPGQGFFFERILERLREFDGRPRDNEGRFQGAETKGMDPDSMTAAYRSQPPAPPQPQQIHVHVGQRSKLGALGLLGAGAAAGVYGKGAVDKAKEYMSKNIRFETLVALNEKLNQFDQMRQDDESTMHRIGRYATTAAGLGLAGYGANALLKNKTGMGIGDYAKQAVRRWQTPKLPIPAVTPEFTKDVTGNAYRARPFSSGDVKQYEAQGQLKEFNQPAVDEQGVPVKHPRPLATAIFGNPLVTAYDAHPSQSKLKAGGHAALNVTTKTAKGTLTGALIGGGLGYAVGHLANAKTRMREPFSIIPHSGGAGGIAGTGLGAAVLGAGVGAALGKRGGKLVGQSVGHQGRDARAIYQKYSQPKAQAAQQLEAKLDAALVEFNLGQKALKIGGGIAVGGLAAAGLHDLYKGRKAFRNSSDFHSQLKTLPQEDAKAISAQAGVDHAGNYSEIRGLLRKNGSGPIGATIKAVPMRAMLVGGKNAFFVPKGKGFIGTKNQAPRALVEHEIGHAKDYASLGGQPGWDKTYQREGIINGLKNTYSRKHYDRNVMAPEHAAWSHVKDDQGLKAPALGTYSDGFHVQRGVNLLRVAANLGGNLMPS